MKKHSRLRWVLYPVCLLLILFGAWSLWQNHRSTRDTTQLYDTLASQVHAEQEAAASPAVIGVEGKLSTSGTVSSPAESEKPVSNDVQAGTGAQSDSAQETEAAEEPEEEPETPVIVNQWLVDLQQKNPELVGWLTVPDTTIDYPVMQTGEDNDFYLTHDFQKQEESHGTPFLDPACRLGTDRNLIIYGHNKLDGTMFQPLTKYESATYAAASSPIVFETPEQTAQFEVIYVMLITVAETEAFPYYQYISLSDPADYQEYLDSCSRYAVWSRQDAAQTPAGTQLLTLSTCEYNRKNERLMVIARQLAD